MDRDLPPPLTREAEQHAGAVLEQLERLRPVTLAHARRVARLAVRVARHMHLPDVEVRHIEWGALLHDIGEMQVKPTLLDKPGPLDACERALVCEHALVGARWLGAVPTLAPLVPFARWHHERFDASGYPDALPGGRLPMAVALVAVCDTWDALTTPRPYRAPLSRADAVEEMQRNAGRQWSRALVDWLLDVVDARPVSPR